MSATSILFGLLCIIGACMALQASSTSFSPKAGIVQRDIGLMRLRGGAPAKTVSKTPAASNGNALKCITSVILTPKTVLLVAIAGVVKSLLNGKVFNKKEEPKKAAAPPAKKGCLGLGCCGL